MLDHLLPLFQADVVLMVMLLGTVCLLAQKAGTGNSFLNPWPLLIKTIRAETLQLCCREGEWTQGTKESYSQKEVSAFDDKCLYEFGSS